MTELRRLASALEKDTDNKDDLYKILHWVGLRGSTRGFNDFISFLGSIYHILNSIELLHPNLSPVTDVLKNVSKLEMRLTEIPQTGHYDLSTPKEWFYRPTEIKQQLPCTSILPVEIPLHKSSAEAFILYIACYLIDIIWTPYSWRLDPEYLTALNLLPKLLSPVPHAIEWSEQGQIPPSSKGRYSTSISSMMRYEDVYPLDLMHSTSGKSIDEVTISECFDAIIDDYESRQLKLTKDSYQWKSVSEIKDQFKRLRDLILNVELDENLIPKLLGMPPFEVRLRELKNKGHKSNIPDDKEWRWGKKATVDLTDRHLFEEHKNALTADMKYKIYESIYTLRVNNFLPSIGLHDIDAIAAYAVSICLPTGNLVKSTLEIRVLPHEDLIVLSQGRPLSSGFISHISLQEVDEERQYFWNPPGRPPNLQLQLKLHPQWPDHCTDFLIGDFLRLQNSRLLNVVESSAAALIHRRVPTSRLFLKHELGRSLFSIDANRALIRYVCGPGNGDKESNPARSSLHHYIDPLSPRIAQAFEIAQRRVFGLNTNEDIVAFRNGLPSEQACSLVNPKRITSIFTAHRKIIANTTTDVIKQHNRFARYVALLLLIATGHRRTKQLFHFWFSLNSEEQTAFIADKQTIGSEARFVALATIAISQINEYIKHILWLIDKLRGQDDALVAQIQLACGLDTGSIEKLPTSLSFLFNIRHGKIRGISTESLKRWAGAVDAKDETDEPISARLMRRNIATFLSNKGISGDGVALFLGHNGPMHSWGASSHLIPQSVHESVRTHIDEYLKANGAIPMAAPWIDSRYRKYREIVPSIELSNASYELRKTELDEARDRARVAIQAVLSVEAIEKRGIDVIDDEVVSQIREEISESLFDDAEAKKQVLAELVKFLDILRKFNKIDANSTLLNLIRTTPGPLDIVFGRHLKISNIFIKELPAAVISYMKVGEPQLVKYLAVISVLLASTEGVMNLVDVKALIEALQIDGPHHFEGQVRLRATVETRAAIYERTCDLSDACSAAVFGYMKCKSDFANAQRPQIDWEDIIPHISNLLKLTQIDLYGFNFKKLLTIIRPYWLLRLTGTAYACCIGQYHTSSESSRSTSMLVGASEAATSKGNKRYTRPALEKGTAIKNAVDALNALMTKIIGNKNLFTDNKRIQRIELRKTFDEGASDDLLACIEQQSIVESWYEFLRYLVEVGGPKTDIYAPSSIRTYQSNAMQPLFEAAWDVDILDFDESQFNEFYKVMFEDKKSTQNGDLKKVIKIFHEFLTVSYNAPGCVEFPAVTRRKHRARNEVFSNDVLVGTLDNLVSAGKYLRGPEKQTKNYYHSAQGLVVFIAGWGLRPAEAYGLQHRQLDLETSGRPLNVRRNRGSTIKTSSGTRNVPFHIGGDNITLFAKSIYKVNYSYKLFSELKELDTWIFSDPDNQAVLIGWSQTRARASWAVKEASGNQSSVSYSFRHTYATSVSFGLLCQNPIIPILKCFAKHLPEVSNIDLHPSWTIYGKGIDRISMWLGHSGPDTFIRTYGHCIWWSASNSCNINSPKLKWKQEFYATLIGIDRSMLSKAANENLNLFKFELLQHHLKKYIKEFGPNLPEIKPIDSLSKASYAAPAQTNAAIEDIILLLDLRHYTNFDISRLGHILSHNHNIEINDAILLSNSYILAVNESSINDFEPFHQRSGRRERTGVSRERGSRKRLIRSIDRYLNKSTTNRAITAELIKLWRLLAMAKTPGLYSSTLIDAKLSAQWLLDLGYECKDILITHFNARQNDVEDLRASDFECAISSEQLSRVNQIIPNSEFIVSPITSSKLPVKHDFQRCLFILSIWDIAGKLSFRYDDVTEKS